MESFFSKDEFYNTLKGKAENSKKKLYMLLEMRDLSDLNDIYNAHELILLLEIIENRF